MAFIVLRRSRNTRSYLLIESYRDEQGRNRKRTLCYLGREADGTNTLEKARAHWEKVRDQAKAELKKERGERRSVIRRRIEAATARIAIIAQHQQLATQAEAERQQRLRQVEELSHWAAFDRLRRYPSETNAKAAKRAFLFLAKRHHPDQGGTHQDFLRLKDTYDKAVSAWRRVGGG
jgi:hypothetical protein